MTRRELAELILSGRKAAKRVSARLVLDHTRIKAMGLTEADIEMVERGVNEIERVTEVQLAALD